MNETPYWERRDGLIGVRLNVQDNSLMPPPSNIIGAVILHCLFKRELEHARILARIMNSFSGLNQTDYIFEVTDVSAAIPIIKGILADVSLEESSVICFHDEHEVIWRRVDGNGNVAEFGFDRMHRSQGVLQFLKECMEGKPLPPPPPASETNSPNQNPS